jgi:hypothetical protein
MQLQLSKPVLIIIAVAVIGLSVLGWYLSRPQGIVEFAVAPQEITVNYQGKSHIVKNGQKISLSPGTYDATFTRDDFQTETSTIVVKNKETSRVVIALTPLTDAAKQLLANSESQKVVKEYQAIQYKELIKTLPLAGVNYTISACQSIKEPDTDNKALCIAAKTTAGQAAARKSLEDLGYNLDDLEVYNGTENLLTVILTDTYRIDYYPNTKIEHATKKPLFVTPLNVPYVSAATSTSQQLEDIKSAALSDLKERGYDVNKFDIYYSNVYLSRYNPVTEEKVDHYSAPIPPTN